MDMFSGRNVLPAGVLVFLMAATAGPLASQEGPQEIRFEEIVVNFDVPRLVNSDIFAQYDGAAIYLPLLDIFRLLEVNCAHDRDTRRISGYLYSKSDTYELDFIRGVVHSFGEESQLPRDGYMYDGHECYLRIDLMERFFNMPMQFDFSRLQVRLPLNPDFPAYQKLKRRLEQEKLLAGREEAHEVYSLAFRREYLMGGVADWTLSTNPLGNRRTHYYSLGLGAMLLGGDITVSGNGDTRTGIDSRQLRYKWHYYVDNNSYLTQVELGDVFIGGHFSRRLDGLMVTNRPQVRRKYFQTIDLSGYLGEGWEVELYVDHRLVDFTKTDHAGEYHFNLDIFYGASSITVKMYGPNGELRVEEKDIKIPYNLIPRGELEYAATVGQADGSMEKGLFAQAGCFYGITTGLTAGISADLPLKVDLPPSAAGESRPLVGGEMAFQPLTNLTMNGFIAPDYALQGGVSFTRPSVFNIYSGFTRYRPNMIRNPLGQIHNISFAVSSPLKLWGRQLGLRCNLAHDRYPKSSHISAHYGFSSSISHFYFNYIGRYKVSEYDEANRSIRTVSSQLILGSRRAWLVRPQFRIDYDHDRNEIVKYGVFLSRRVFRTGQLSFSYERNEVARSNLYMVTFNIFTNFADFNTRVIASSDQVAMTQSQHGSIRFNRELGAIHLNRRSGVGQCSAVLRPFVDGNFNGVYDEGEEYIRGMRARIKGASGQPLGKDRLYYYDRLQPYDEYVVQIDEYSLDNPLLKPVHEGYRVHFNPNMVTAIEVPVVVVSEISGRVQRQLDHGRTGIGGVKIQLLNLATGSRTEITTFNNGEFYYLGLIPGTYRARILPAQLDAYGYVSEPETVDFEVVAVEGGSVVENVNFLLIPK